MHYYRLFAEMALAQQYKYNSSPSHGDDLCCLLFVLRHPAQPHTKEKCTNLK